MNINAEIICRREEGYGTVCEWEGPSNGLARVYGEYLFNESRYQIDRDKVYEFGRLKLRVIQFPYFEDGMGAMSDSAVVMLESPHAQLYQLYRRKAESAVRLAMRFEAAYNAFCFRCKHGELMPFTAYVADKLL